MLRAVHYLHKQGLAHRNIKHSNFLVDDQFNIRLVDYGWATPINGKSEDGLLNTDMRPLGYMTPEILS